MARRRRGWDYPQAMGATFAVSVAGMLAVNDFGGMLPWGGQADADRFVCHDIRVVDGDTLRCGGERVRLAGIDAPELAGHCRPGRACTPGDPIASTMHLQRLVAYESPICERKDVDVYGRTIARCRTATVDLSCAQIAEGHAVRRYGFIWC